MEILILCKEFLVLTQSVIGFLRHYGGGLSFSNDTAFC
jgi:hypothetical protein